MQDTLQLNNDIAMPRLGLGVWQSEEGKEVIEAVTHALETGYRSIDTAAIYRNEEGVGQAIRHSGIPRQDVFVTTKVWNTDQRTGATRQGFDLSLKKLGLDYVDLYLIHWPVEGKFIETWQVLQELYSEGLVRSIGVSNFLIHHLEALAPHSDVQPAVNQVEFHPYLIQQDLMDFCQQQNIAVEAWSPLMQGKFLQEELFKELSTKYEKTAAQVLLRWHLDRGVIAIPKSVNKARIDENFQIFDFQLDPADMTRINALDRAHRFGPDPDNFDF